MVSKRMGRPPKSLSEVRSEIVMVRLTKSELREFRTLALATGESIADLLRRGGLERGHRLIRKGDAK